MLSTALVFALVIVQCLSSSSRPPNFIFVITDDQDLTLNSIQAMPKTMSRVADQGITMKNTFAATPVCCASRTETLTGRTFHNIEATTGQTACQHAAADYHMFDNSNSLFQKFHANGYITGAFGKVVNKVTDYWCNQGNFDGFDRIHLSCDYEDFYSTTYFNRYVDGTEDTTTHELDENVYQTAMMGNASVEFIEEMMMEQQDNPDTAQPFIAWFGPYAPHTSATPSAWYSDEFNSVSLDYKTQNYNMLCPNHHSPVGDNQLLSDAVEEQIEQLYKDRLRSLMSVDDMVDAMLDVLDSYGDVGDNTYVIYTSDHGYSLGQFALPCGKMQPYEQTVRVPFYMRGPDISPGSTSEKLVGNIDFLPTMLDLADISYDVNDYDGRSMKDILEDGESYSDEWRSAMLLEFKSVGTFGITHCPIWWPSDDGSVVPGQVLKPGSSLSQNQIDNVETNNWRVLRIIDGTEDKYYAEFYSESGFDADPIDYEYFNLASDPWQETNAYDTLSDDEKDQYAAMLQAYGGCDGADECSPVDGTANPYNPDTDYSYTEDTGGSSNGKGQTKGTKPKGKQSVMNVDGDDTVYEVVVEWARDLEDEDTDFFWITNYNDVYVQIYGYGEDDEKVLQTKTIDGSTEPEWNEETFTFRNDEGNGAYESFKFKLYDEDPILGDDFLGETDNFLTSLIRECNMDYSEEMTVYRDGEESGTLFVTISKDC